MAMVVAVGLAEAVEAKVLEGKATVEVAAEVVAPVAKTAVVVGVAERAAEARVVEARAAVVATVAAADAEEARAAAAAAAVKAPVVTEMAEAGAVEMVPEVLVVHQSP